MSDEKKQKVSYIRSEHSQEIFYRLSVFFMFVYIVLPQYFGLNTPGFDLTAQRIGILLLLFYVMENAQRSKDFWVIIKKSEFLPYMCIYLFILLYTAVFRAHLGTFLYSLLELLAMYLVIYIVREVIGVKRCIRIILILAYVLCILGLIEYVMKRTPFAYLETIHGLYTGGMIRSGSYRIMGPANHSLAYGLILITLLPLSCIDLENDEVNITEHLSLFLLLIVNIFLTGSRSTLAVMFLEILVLFCFSPKESKKKALLYTFFFLVVLALFVVAFYGTPISRYILLQISSVIDEVFGTSYAVKFGADVTTLYNSSNYRSYLPQIFSHPSLNPLLGRGSGYAFTWYVDGYFIKSIDNFYVASYIRYAYPGLIAYMLLILKMSISMLREGVKHKSGLCLAMFGGVLCYFVNMWWLDTLQTIKYVYILFALFYACFDKTDNVYSESWKNADAADQAGSSIRSWRDMLIKK